MPEHEAMMLKLLLMEMEIHDLLIDTDEVISDERENCEID